MTIAFIFVLIYFNSENLKSLDKSVNNASMYLFWLGDNFQLSPGAPFTNKD